MQWTPNRPLTYKERPTRDAEAPGLILAGLASDPRSSEWRINGQLCRLAYSDEGNQCMDKILHEISPEMESLSKLKAERKRIRDLLRARKRIVWLAAWRDGIKRHTYQKRIFIARVPKIVTRLKPFKVKRTVTLYRWVTRKTYGIRVRVRVPYRKTIYETRYKTVRYQIWQRKYSYVQRTNYKMVVFEAKSALGRDRVVQQLNEAYLEAIMLVAKRRNEVVSHPNHCRATSTGDSQLFPPFDDTHPLSITGWTRSLPSGIWTGGTTGPFGLYPGSRWCYVSAFLPGPSTVQFQNDTGPIIRSCDVTDVVLPHQIGDFEQHWESVTQRALTMRSGRVDILDDAFVAVRSLAELRDAPKTYTGLHDFYRFLKRMAKKGPMPTRWLGEAAKLYLTVKFGIQPTAEDVGLLCAESATYALNARRSLQKLVESLLREPSGRSPLWVHLRQRVGGPVEDSVPCQTSAAPVTDSEVLEFKSLELKDGSSVPLGAWLDTDKAYSGVFTGNFIDTTGQYLFTTEGRIEPRDERVPRIEDVLLRRNRLQRILHTGSKYQTIVFAKATLEKAFNFAYYDSGSLARFMDWSQPLKTSWELFPLSFIIDWFSTTNQVAQAVQDLASLKLGDALVEEVWYSTRQLVYAALDLPDLIFTSSLVRSSTSTLPASAPDGRAHGWEWYYYKDLTDKGWNTASLTCRVGLTVTRSSPSSMQRTQIKRYERGLIRDYSPATRPSIRVSINRGKLLSLAAVVTTMVDGLAHVRQKH